MEKAMSRSLGAIGKVVLAVMLAVGMVNAASFEVKAEDEPIGLTQDNIKDFIYVNENIADNEIDCILNEGSYYLGENINLEDIGLDYKGVYYNFFVLYNITLDLKGHELSATDIHVGIGASTIYNSSDSEGKISAPGCSIKEETYLNNVTIECSQNPSDHEYDKFLAFDSANVKIENSSISSYDFEVFDENLTMSSGCISCTEFLNYGKVTVTGGSVNVSGEITNNGTFQYAVWLDSNVATSLDDSLVDGKYTLVDLGESYSVTLKTAGNDCLTLSVDGYDGYDYDYDSGVLTCDKIESVVEIDVKAYESHKLQHTEAKEVTCTEDGNSEYWYCDQCGRYFSDGNAKTEINEEDIVFEPATGHSWKEIRTEVSDAYKDEIAITLTCETCGKETLLENLVIETISRDINAHSTLKWSDLINANDIVALFEDGAKEIDFDLSVSKNEEVSESDAELIEVKINELYSDIEYTISYLDIDVSMYIKFDDGNDEVRNFTETLNPVTITVELPKELQDAEGNEYTVIRIHNGEAEAIDCSEKDDMISFTSDKFSTYAIVKINEAGQGSAEPALSETDGENIDANSVEDETDDEIEETANEEAEESDSVKTDDNTNMFIYMLGLGLSLAGIVLYERKRRYNN